MEVESVLEQCSFVFQRYCRAVLRDGYTDAPPHTCGVAGGGGWVREHYFFVFQRYCRAVLRDGFAPAMLSHFPREECKTGKRRSCAGQQDGLREQNRNSDDDYGAPYQSKNKVDPLSSHSFLHFFYRLPDFFQCEDFGGLCLPCGTYILVIFRVHVGLLW